MNKKVYFVSGIDTDAGKSFATGYLAKLWNGQGIRTITQKFIQTGNNDFSEDIALHRKIMQMEYTEEDRQKWTMPEIFSYPASPHLASQIDHRPINLEKITEATWLLAQRYDAVLVEGAGGLMVPLNDQLFTIDYIAQNDYPIIFVTSSKLGSINHTLLSLEAIKSRKLNLHMLIYNQYPKEKELIEQDTQKFLKAYLAKEFPQSQWMDLPHLSLN